MILIKQRLETFLWHWRNRRHWNRGAVKHWWDWFALEDPKRRHLVPQYKLRKYKRWLQKKEKGD